MIDLHAGRSYFFDTEYKEEKKTHFNTPPLSLQMYMSYFQVCNYFATSLFQNSSTTIKTFNFSTMPSGPDGANAIYRCLIGLYPESPSAWRAFPPQFSYDKLLRGISRSHLPLVEPIPQLFPLPPRPCSLPHPEMRNKTHFDEFSHSRHRLINCQSDSSHVTFPTIYL